MCDVRRQQLRLFVEHPVVILTRDTETAGDLIVSVLADREPRPGAVDIDDNAIERGNCRLARSDGDSL